MVGIRGRAVRVRARIGRAWTTTERLGAKVIVNCTSRCSSEARPRHNRESAEIDRDAQPDMVHCSRPLGSKGPASPGAFWHVAGMQNIPGQSEFYRQGVTVRLSPHRSERLFACGLPIVWTVRGEQQERLCVLFPLVPA
jgi:hypothetical protein